MQKIDNFVSQEIQADVCASYISGLGMRNVGLKHKLKECTVKAILKKNCIKSRSLCEALTHKHEWDTKENLNNLYELHGIKKVAKMCMVDQATIRHRLLRYGIIESNEGKSTDEIKVIHAKNTSIGLKKVMHDPEHKKKMSLALSKIPKCSSIQSILYSILDDLNIKYFREYSDKPADKETVIGPWSFDCVIPRKGKPTLLIECQGDYFHNLDKNSACDKAKATYISSTFQEEYELKTIWEHEFKCQDKISELIKYWMDITKIEAIDFNFNDIIIKNCLADEYKPFLGKYHYLSNAGRGGNVFGAYLNNDLIGCAVYSPVIRQNINISGFKQEEVRELSRLCIHPKYQKKNFASWLIAKSLKELNEKYRCIISYSDKTFNHDGTVYKASNFINDSIVPIDYWYVDNNGWKMHKKTLYGHAKSLKQTEKEFADSNGYIKVYGKEKKRWVFRR